MSGLTRDANAFGAKRAEELAMHPTVKPVGLVADAIRDCSRRGDLVLDSFGGSGTTLIACERTHRKAQLDRARSGLLRSDRAAVAKANRTNSIACSHRPSIQRQQNNLGDTGAPREQWSITKVLAVQTEAWSPVMRAPPNIIRSATENLQSGRGSGREFLETRKAGRRTARTLKR